MMASLNKIIASRFPRFLRRLWPWGLGVACLCLILTTHLSAVRAQSADEVETQEDAVIEQYSLPQTAPQAPVVRPRPQAPTRPAQPSAPPPARAPQRSTPVQPQPAAQPSAADPPETASEPPSEVSQTDDEAVETPLSKYVLQFNRSPVVGNALQMSGVLSQARLGFTRPQHWQVDSAKVHIRFRHSPALYAERSNLTVQLNNVHLGSIPLNRTAEEIGNVAFNVPVGTLQDYNTIVMQVQQHTSPDCTDPTDPALWTEILPDSQVVIDYRPQPIALDLANYPYPFLNELGLDADQLAYLEPVKPDDAWMTSAARYQASAARLTNFRSIQTRMIKTADEVKAGEKLVVIGTPATQPGLATLNLPFEIKNERVLDGGGNILPNDVGIIMLTTTADGSHPVLVVTGNDGKGVLKAVQALVQPSDRQLLTGQAALVSSVAAIDPIDRDNWQGFIPQDTDRFRLSDLVLTDFDRFEDITVNGLPVPPPVRIPFKALPDDQFLRGSTFSLRYSYSPNVDPARSSVSVRIDGQALGGKRLRNVNGDTDSITVNIPPGVVTPASELEVQFFMYPRTAISCGDIPDQPMWGTVHGDSSFKLNRTSFVQLPNLKLLQVGYPLTAPQDLSDTAFVLPKLPTAQELMTLLQASSRLGRLSQADTVKLEVYSPITLPEKVRQDNNLVGIGVRNRFPLPELFEGQNDFALGEQFLRSRNRSQVQTLPDEAGVIESAVSPWNKERVLLGFTAQSDAGLADIQDMLYRDELFSQLEGDTVLVQQTVDQPSLFTADDYQVIALTQATPESIDRRSFLTRIIALLQANWFLIPGVIVLLVLLLYGVSQLYLNRTSHTEGV